ICLPISPHPLFTFDLTNILYRCGGVPPCGEICLPISPHPLFTFDQTNILYRCGVPPCGGYVYQFHHTRSLRSIKQIFYTVAASRLRRDMSTNFTTPALYVRSNKYFHIVAASRLRRDMSTNFTTPALYVRSNKYFVPLRRPA